LPGEQVVGADAEPVTELDEQIKGRGCLVALDAGDVLVRDAQLACKLDWLHGARSRELASTRRTGGGDIELRG
jgi:hypothetical protein